MFEPMTWFVCKLLFSMRLWTNSYNLCTYRDKQQDLIYPLNIEFNHEDEYFSFLK